MKMRLERELKEEATKQNLLVIISHLHRGVVLS